ncbi:MAG: class I adenylate-forming enzyme family protein [Byssovorax sp.]
MTPAIPLLHDYLHDAAARLPSKIALVCQNRRLSYREIDAAANQLAHALVERGVARGDRVVVLCDNTPEAVIAFWAVLRANAVVSMVHPQTRVDKLAYLLNDCRASALVADGSFTPLVAEAAPRSPHLRTTIIAGRFDAERLSGVRSAVALQEAVAGHAGDRAPARLSIDIDLASIIYTSGSTGEPKGVMLTHRNMLTAAASICTYLRNTEDDIILGVLPLSFDYGLYQMIMAFRMGARLVLERSFAFPTQVLNRVVEERVTGFPGVPTIFAVMSDMKTLRDFDFSRVRYVTNTAAALPVKHILMLRELFPTARIYSMYGLTECKRCTYLPPEDIDRKPTSVGVAIPNTEMWIVDDDDHRVPPGTVGQLVIRGATVMAGYWEKPEATARKLRPGPIPGQVVLYTGDYCKMDEDGYLYFVGRMDDIIKSRGEKVAPKEIEHTLLAAPGVKEAVVIGIPDEVLGQAPLAFVVLEDGSSSSEALLRRHCQERLEGFKVPKSIVVRSALPRSPNGKIDKRALTEELDRAGGAGETRSEASS